MSEVLDLIITLLQLSGQILALNFQNNGSLPLAGRHWLKFCLHRRKLIQLRLKPHHLVLCQSQLLNIVPLVDLNLFLPQFRIFNL